MTILVRLALAQHTEEWRLMRRVGGKSDLIDALAIVRAALREPRLDWPRREESRLRELKLLVDHVSMLRRRSGRDDVGG